LVQSPTKLISVHIVPQVKVTTGFRRNAEVNSIESVVVVGFISTGILVERKNSSSKKFGVKKKRVSVGSGSLLLRDGKLLTSGSLHCLYRYLDMGLSQLYT
jgi:hypothetical protein